MNLSRLFTYVVTTFGLFYFLWFNFQPKFFWFTHFCVICGLLVLSWIAGYWFYDLLNTKKVSSSGRIVLITGCDTGFGHELAIELDRIGFHVFAGVLHLEGDGSRILKSKCSQRLRVIQMDVTKQNEVENVVEEIRKTKKQLWAVINNAGIGLSTFFDWGNDVDEHKRLFEVDLFGLIRVTKCCMPLLKEAKGGRIVNVSSFSGRITFCCCSHYSMAKHSVRVFSDALRRELLFTKDPIQVITIEPALYRTQINQNTDQMNRTRKRIIRETPETTRASYDMDLCTRLFQVGQSEVTQISRSETHEVTDAIVKAVALKHPKLFYRCCSFKDIPLLLLSQVPEVLFDKILHFYEPNI